MSVKRYGYGTCKGCGRRSAATKAGRPWPHNGCGSIEPMTDILSPDRPAPDLSPAEAERVARFDAAEAAPESLRERVADALAVELDSLGLSGEMSSRASDYLADAALAVIRGEAS